jgi:hypothetical protein
MFFISRFRFAASPLAMAGLIALSSSPARAALPGRGGSIDGVPATRAVAPQALIEALAAIHANVPAFSRQTGLACSACHYQFPQLTPFGRLFKLNGYTLTALPTIGQPGDSAGKGSLRLSSIPGVAAMLVTSLTQLKTAAPGTQNGTVVMPDQFSIFAAGAITPNLGGFTQFTYSAVDGGFGIDNIDIRYANHRTLADRDWIYGVTLNNNPTVQDVWNTVPAWGFPFMSSPVAPAPAASTLIDGGLEQSVLGIGAYSLFDNLLYTEVSVYRSSPQGAAMPLDTTAENVTSGLTPYWRVALQHEAPNTSLMLGTFGMNARLFPTGVTGPRDHVSDVAVDAQVEQRSGAAAWIGRASYIREREQLDATLLAGGADNVDQHLSTARASLGYVPSLRYALTLGYFQTTGTTDATLRPAGPLTGSSTGSPNSSALTGEFDFNAWQNTRLGAQYTAYNKFNGAKTAYDIVGGRSAADNNTLYLYMWVAF